MNLLYSNAATLPDPQGGVHHRHIGIIMKPALYTTLYTTEWIKPTNTGLHPMVPPKSTNAHQYQIKLQNNKCQRIYGNTGTMDVDLKNQFIDYVDGTYLKELKK